MNIKKILLASGAVCVLVITLSISYYLVFFLPKQAEAELELKKQEQSLKEKQMELDKQAQEASILNQENQLNLSKQAKNAAILNQENQQIEIYRKECTAKSDENQKKFENFLNVCPTDGRSVDYCINSDAGKVFAESIGADFISGCVNAMKNRNY
jgi:biopolymer transport protein ExbB/TolQ